MLAMERIGYLFGGFAALMAIIYGVWNDFTEPVGVVGLTLGALLGFMIADDAPEGALDIAIEIGDSVLTHRRRFSLEASVESVVALLALDPMNPRSILFQVAEINDQVQLLPDGGLAGRAGDLARATLRLHTELATAQAQEVDAAFLERVHGELEIISDLVAAAYLG